MFSTQTRLKAATHSGIVLRTSARLSGFVFKGVTFPCARRLRRRLEKLGAAPLPELRQRLRSLGLNLTLSPLALVALSGVTLADPLGGVVVSGQASISQPAAGHTVIQQTTNKAIIDWQSFNIGAGEHTQFIQPSTDSITLNRVTSGGASEILGRLTANGGIMLINQHGIIIGQGAEIDVGSLVGSAADLSNDDFNAGNYHFNKGAQAAARIENHGRIQTRSAGSVALVAPYVSNHGTITAHLGRIQLASGNTWTLDMGGMVKLALEDKVAGSLIQAGLIEADGGHIELTANVVETMLHQALQIGGTTRAHTVGVNQKGNIVIGGGAASGTVTVNGTLDISGLGTGQTAGSVTITGQRVAVMPNAEIDARGNLGGGSIKIGGDYQGGGTTHRAERTYIAQGATLKADATDEGRGGRVIVWSDEGTQFYGDISARGGFVSGDGGFVEVSGLGGLDFAGTVTTTAFNGNNGTLLLDPYDLTISNAADSDVSGATPFSSTANSGVLNITTLQNALASGNVVVQTGAAGAQSGDITVTDAIAWTGNNSLTLQAHRNITVNNTITNSGGTGGLTLTSTGATGAITINNGLAVGGDMTISANTLALNANLSGGGVLSLYPNLAATTITLGTGGTGVFNLDINEFGRIQDGWSSITLGRADGTGTIDLRALTWNDPLTIQSLTGAVTTNGTQTMGANDLTIRTNSINLAVANSLTGSGTLTIEQANNTTTMGFGTSATGTLNLDANEVGRITDGWNLINLGRTDNTVGMQIRGTTWNDPVVFRNGSGAITTSTGNTVGNGNASFTYNGAMTLSNNITTVSGDIIFNNTLTIGSGLTPVITTTSGNIIFNSTVNGVAGGSAENLTITGGAGSSVDFTTTVGATNPLGSLSITADSLNLGGNITGTATLTLQPGSNTTSLGIGDGASGTFHLSDAEVSRIQNGFTSILVGRTTSTATFDLRTSTWNDPVNFRGSSTGNISLNGTLTGTGNASITLSGASTIAEGQTATLNTSTGTGGITISGTLNGTAGGSGESLTINTGVNTFTTSAAIGGVSAIDSLNLTADLITLGANIIGTGTATISPFSQSQTIGIGNSAVGLMNLSTTEMGYFVNGWGQLVIGRSDGTGAINIRGISINDPLTIRTDTGAITQLSAGLIGAGNASFNFEFNNSFVNSLGLTTAGGDVTFSGLGTLTLSGNITTAGGDIDFNTPVTIGSGLTPVLSFGAGTVTVDNTINGIAGGSAENLTFTGGAGSSVTVNSAIGGTTALGAITLTTDNLDLAANLTGTGALVIQQAAATTTMGLGDSMAGTLHLSDAEIARIQNGFTTITLGATTATGAMQVGSAAVWYDPLTLRSAAGGSLQVLGSLLADDNATITLSTAPITLGDASSIITNGRNITLSTATTLAEGASASISTGAGAGNITFSNTVNGTAGGVNENLTIIAGTGTFTNSGIIGGVTPLGDFSVTADLMTISQNINGLGILTLQPQSQGQTIGVGTSAAGLFNLDTNEQQRLDSTWSNIILGRADGTGAIDLRAATWVDPLTIRGGSATLTVNGAQTMGSNNLTISTDGLSLLANLSGTGDLIIEPGQQGTTLGLGNSSVGALNLTNTELAFLPNGWNSITFGRTDGTGAIDLRAYTWNDPLTIRSDTGLITTNGSTTGAGNASITLNAPTLLGHNITTASQQITFGSNLTLAQDVTLSTGAGAGDITFNDTLDGGSYNLTLTAGTGSILFADAVTNLGSGTGAALTVNSATLTQADSTFTANSGLNINSNSLWANNITLGNGDTASNFNGDITFDGLTLSGYDGFTFLSPVTLTGAGLSVNSNGGNITFSDTLDGAQSLTLALSGGDLNFAGILGGTTALTSISATGLGLLSTSTINASSFTSVGTGNASFGGSGLNLSGNFSVTANDISGDITGNIGSLLAQGDITANLNVSGLTISGVSATLLGNVGLGLQDQIMANRVIKTNTTSPRADYTLNGFEIGYNLLPENTDVMTLSVWGPTSAFANNNAWFTLNQGRNLDAIISQADQPYFEKPDSIFKEPKRRGNKYKKMGRTA